MVHALREIHRTLRPAGLLIDLRPITTARTLEILRPSGAEYVGDFEVLETDPDDEAANAAVRAVLASGLFRRERAGQFQLATYWASVDEMKAFVDERWTSARLPAALEAAARAEFARGENRLRSYATMVITRLAKDR